MALALSGPAPGAVTLLTAEKHRQEKSGKPGTQSSFSCSKCVCRHTRLRLTAKKPVEHTFNPRAITLSAALLLALNSQIYNKGVAHTQVIV